MNVLYVNKQEFSASSWRSNQGYTKMYGQPIIKISPSGVSEAEFYVLLTVHLGIILVNN
jgi:hypothetical protein